MNDLESKVGALTKVVGDLGSQLYLLIKSVRRSKISLIIIAISLSLDLILSCGLLYSLHQTNEAQIRTKNAIVQICDLRNEQALKQHQLWDGIIHLVPKTQTQPEALNQFNNLINATYPQNDCSHIGK